MREHSTTGYEQRVGSRYKSAEIQVLSCVRGYHVCKDRWAATVGELLTYSREPTNASIRYAVAAIKKGTIIGHLPKSIFKEYSVFFLRSNSVISCKVTGSRCFFGRSAIRGTRDTIMQFQHRKIFVLE